MNFSGNISFIDSFKLWLKKALSWTTVKRITFLSLLFSLFLFSEQAYILFLPHALLQYDSVSCLLHVSLISHTYAIPCVYSKRKRREKDKSVLRNILWILSLSLCVLKMPVLLIQCLYALWLVFKVCNSPQLQNRNRKPYTGFEYIKQQHWLIKWNKIKWDRYTYSDTFLVRCQFWKR